MNTTYFFHSNRVADLAGLESMANGTAQQNFWMALAHPHTQLLSLLQQSGPKVRTVVEDSGKLSQPFQGATRGWRAEGLASRNMICKKNCTGAQQHSPENGWTRKSADSRCVTWAGDRYPRNGYRLDVQVGGRYARRRAPLKEAG